MKKLLSLALLCGIFISAKSQVYVQGGVNLANITKTNSGQTQNNNLLTTFNAGFLGRFGLSQPLTSKAEFCLLAEAPNQTHIFPVPQAIIM